MRGFQSQTRPLAIMALIFMSIPATVMISNSFCIQGDDASRYALGATSPAKELHDPYKLAKEQSFGFFDDIHENTWKRISSKFTLIMKITECQVNLWYFIHTRKPMRLYL
jgi:hypothetical protein